MFELGRGPVSIQSCFPLQRKAGGRRKRRGLRPLGVCCLPPLTGVLLGHVTVWKVTTSWCLSFQFCRARRISVPASEGRAWTVVQPQPDSPSASLPDHQQAPGTPLLGPPRGFCLDFPTPDLPFPPSASGKLLPAPQPLGLIQASPVPMPQRKEPNTGHTEAPSGPGLQGALGPAWPFSPWASVSPETSLVGNFASGNRFRAVCGALAPSGGSRTRCCSNEPITLSVAGATESSAHQWRAVINIQGPAPRSVLRVGAGNGLEAQGSG